MGWHEILYKSCLDIAAGRPTDEPTGETLMLDSGTSNFKWMSAAWWYGWALASGSSSKLAAAQERVLSLYAEERRTGHQLLEQTCPSPHDNFHRMAHAVIRALVVKQSQYLTSVNQARTGVIGEQNAIWWGWRLALDRAGATPDGQIILPGCRGDGAPLSQVADSIYRMCMGLPQRGPAAREPWWQDPAYGGGAPSILRDLMGPGPWKITIPDLPKLRLKMEGTHYSGGFKLSLAGSPERTPIISEVSVRFNAPGQHRIEFVKDWDESTRAVL